MSRSGTTPPTESFALFDNALLIQKQPPTRDNRDEQSSDGLAAKRWLLGDVLPRQVLVRPVPDARHLPAPLVGVSPERPHGLLVCRRAGRRWSRFSRLQLLPRVAPTTGRGRLTERATPVHAARGQRRSTLEQARSDQDRPHSHAAERSEHACGERSARLLLGMQLDDIRRDWHPEGQGRHGNRPATHAQDL